MEDHQKQECMTEILLDDKSKIKSTKDILTKLVYFYQDYFGQEDRFLCNNRQPFIDSYNSPGMFCLHKISKK